MWPVYGDKVHLNNGTHLVGGVSKDGMMQTMWRSLVILPQHHYHLPEGPIGRQACKMVSEELDKIRTRKTNSESLIVLLICILTRDPNVKTVKAIRELIANRMEQWKQGAIQELYTSTMQYVRENMRKKQGRESPEQRAQTFNNMVMRGKLCSAMKYVTERESGGVLSPTDDDTRHYPDGHTRTVKETFQTKHPKVRTPTLSSLETYESLPRQQKKIIDEEIIQRVAGRLSGGAGLGGTDATTMQMLISGRGRASKALRESIMKFSEWLINKDVPWSAIRAFVSNRVIALDKRTGIRPIGIGKFWRRLFCKICMAICADEATDACRNLKLCGGVRIRNRGSSTCSKTNVEPAQRRRRISIYHG